MKIFLRFKTGKSPKFVEIFLRFKIRGNFSKIWKIQNYGKNDPNFQSSEFVEIFLRFKIRQIFSKIQNYGKKYRKHSREKLSPKLRTTKIFL